MNIHKKLLIFLLFIPGFLAEVLSGNTSILKFLSLVDVFFLVLAYGLPVLLIRELQVRYHISYIGVFILGIVYGIFNEGFIAKTILDTSQIPTGGFQGFGLFAGLNIAWSLMILPWHAFFSVTFPIVFAEHIFPQEKTKSLLSNKQVWFFAFLLYGGLVVFGKDWQGSIPGSLLILLYSVSYILIFLSLQLQEIVSKDIFPHKRASLVGFLTIGVYLFFFLGAGSMDFYMYGILGCFFWIMLVRYFSILSPGQMVHFGWGSYLSFGGMATLNSIGEGRIDLIIVYPIILFIMYYVVLRKNA